MLAPIGNVPGYPPEYPRSAVTAGLRAIIGTEALGRVRSGAEKGRQIARCIDFSFNLHPLPGLQPPSTQELPPARRRGLTFIAHRLLKARSSDNHNARRLP